MGEINKQNFNKIHNYLSYSYFVFFIALIFGIFIDLMMPEDLFFYNQNMFLLGIFFIVISSLLIFWSQRSSKNIHTKKEIHKNAFYAGPYSFTKTPTHIGLLFLITGFGLILGSFFIIFFAILAFLIDKYTFLKKYEELLEDRHGHNYREYKKKVHF